MLAAALAVLVAAYAAVGFWLARVFLISADSQAPGAEKVKLELSLK